MVLHHLWVQGKHYKHRLHPMLSQKVRRQHNWTERLLLCWRGVDPKQAESKRRRWRHLKLLPAAMNGAGGVKDQTMCSPHEVGSSNRRRLPY